MRRAVPLLLVLAACQAAAHTPPPPTGPVRLVEPGPGPVAPLVKTALADAARDHRRLLVYVGATWCGPCNAFHAAAARGDLDAALPGLTLLEFDSDLDDGRLRAAGYTSQMIPLFAVPGPDGRASGRAISGARKDRDYVADLTPRIEALL